MVLQSCIFAASGSTEHIFYVCVWIAAGDLHAAKLQLSGLFAELKDEMEEETAKPAR